MKESTRQILEILERAVEAERRFQREYSRGASLAEDPEVKEAFLKLVDDEIHAPDAYGSTIVKVDGKEFRRPGWGGTWVAPWSGPVYVPKDFEISIGLTLSQYGISKEILSVGTHVVVVTIGQDVSITLTITVIEDR